MIAKLLFWNRSSEIELIVKIFILTIIFISLFSFQSVVSIFNFPSSASAADFSHFEPVSNTNDNAIIGVTTDTNPKIGDNPLVSGDEIGVFTSGGLCVGAVFWEDENTSITVWGDDPDTTDDVEGIQAGEEYVFKIWSAATNNEYDANATYSLGSSIYAPDAIVVLESLVGEEIPSLMSNLHRPQEFVLYQNYPNPFNPTTTISFFLPEASHVILKVYNTVGEEVDMLVNNRYSTGVNSIEWDASHHSSGIYFYRLQAGTFEETKRLLLVK